MFEKASRLKLRFASPKGNITTEDLWDLSLTDLDKTAKVVNADLKVQKEESFIEKKSSTSTTLELKLEIIKHVIKTKQEEVESRERSLKKRHEKARIVELIEQKQSEELSSKSIEELKALLVDNDE